MYMYMQAIYMILIIMPQSATEHDAFFFYRKNSFERDTVFRLCLTFFSFENIFEQ